MTMNPLAGIGLVYHHKVPDDKFLFLGTCFAFRHPSFLITAAHCVDNLEPSNIVVTFPHLSAIHDVASIIRHATGDIALLQTPSLESSTVEPFWDCVGNYSLGEEFLAYGFPEDVMGPNQGHPTSRLFRGYFQRFMDYKSFMGYQYYAGELSIPCPGGLSGGPLFRPGAMVMITGLITENIETTTFLESVEDIQTNGAVIRSQYQKVITYGTCLMLHDIKDWLDSNIPKRNR